MTFIAKPKIAHPSLPKNGLGFTRRDYEGALSTLCAGCGHDSITAAIVEAAWELSVEPQIQQRMFRLNLSCFGTLKSLQWQTSVLDMARRRWRTRRASCKS